MASKHKGATLPMVLIISLLSGLIGIGVLEIARQEADIVSHGQAIYLLDQSLENITDYTLNQFLSESTCFSWQQLTHVSDLKGTKSNFLSGCDLGAKQALDLIQINHLDISFSRDTRFCTARPAVGYEVNTFADYEFETRSIAELSSPTSKRAEHFQVWNILGPIEGEFLPENACNQ